jgi:GTPase
MIGVLTRGKLDDGRGLLRAEVFLHKHEIETGRTSAISHQIVGFSSDGSCVNSEETTDSDLCHGEISLRRVIR